MPTKKTDASTDDVSAAPRRRTRAAASKPANDAETVYSPSAGEIAEAAYLRYVNRGGGDGGDFDDWVEAERELSQKQRRQKH